MNKSVKYKNIWSEEELKTLELNSRDIRYLCEEGLVVGVFAFMEILQKNETVKSGVVLAYDNDVPIVCFERSEGIFALESSEYKKFVNSSVESFAKILANYVEYGSLIRCADSEEDKFRIANETINKMKLNDEKAWLDDNNY